MRAARRILLVLAAALVGLLMAEGLARTRAALPGEDLFFDAPDGSPAGMYRRHPRLLLEPVPGFSGEALSLGYRVPVHIDHQGLRGTGLLPGQRRWLSVGDSFTLAAQVAEEHTFQVRLSSQLGFQVLNGGVDGYSTWQAADRYALLDDAVGAEAVILVFFLGNDLLDNHRIASERRHPALVGQPPPPPPERGAVARFFINHSTLLGYLRVALRRWQDSAPDSPVGQRFRQELLPFSKGGAATLAEVLPDSEAALRQLHQEAARRGDRLWVALAPPAFALQETETARTLGVFGLADPAPDAPRTALLEVLQRLGVATCDLLPALQAADEQGTAPYLRFDGHWSPAGHAAVAQALAACVDGNEAP